MRNTSLRTALLIAVLLKRAKKSRARFTSKTVKILSKRERLKVAFVRELRDCLDSLDIALLELARGGFAAIAVSAFEGAPVLGTRAYLPSAERRLLSDVDLLAELELPEFDNGDEADEE